VADLIVMCRACDCGNTERMDKGCKLWRRRSSKDVLDEQTTTVERGRFRVFDQTISARTHNSGDLIRLVRQLMYYV